MSYLTRSSVSTADEGVLNGGGRHGETAQFLTIRSDAGVDAALGVGELRVLGQALEKELDGTRGQRTRG